MQRLPAALLQEALEWRYATKNFDPSKKIDKQTWEALEQTLILTPSSFGVMPYKFIIVQNQELKDKLMAASWNQKQVSDCSHHVIFVAKEKMDEAHVTKYIEHTASIRGISTEDLAGFKKMMMDVLVNKMSAEQSLKWATNQAYIALGNFMTAAAVLGVDACPMEGISIPKYDEILGLVGTGWTTVVACPVGFRSSEDKYATTKKVRFDAKDLVVHK